MLFDEAKLSTHAFQLVERHAGAAGLDTRNAGYELTSSWLLFSLCLYKVAFPLLDRDEPPSWVANLFAELGAYVVKNAADHSDHYLGMMLKSLYPYLHYRGAGLTEARYARLRGYIGVPLHAAEAVILGSIADDEWRESQMGY